MTKLEMFEQPKITGYRKLTVAEVTLMNQSKELAELVGELVQSLRETPGVEVDQRWVDIAETELQKGFMSLVRSIARPTTF